ncbi:MAG: DUF3617 family protein [Smithellaceae bacterium]|nr:DUF3617 family protein [Smithellaceae bacterium]
MWKKLFMILALLSLVAFSSEAYAQFREGLWEITTQVEIRGMQQQMPPTTIRQCITKSDPVPKNQDKNFACKTASQRVSGNTIHYVVECKGREGTMTSTGQSTYTGSTMSGSSQTRLMMKGQPEMQMSSRMTGKYLGACPKK